MAEASEQRSDTGSSRASWRRMLLFLGLVAVLVLVILEGGARLLSWLDSKAGGGGTAPIQAHNMAELDRVHTEDPYCFWVLKPNLDRMHIAGRCWDRDVDFLLSTNADGLRNPPLAPDGARVRILVLGDSITFGLGVNNDETWPAQLERVLNRTAGPATYEVLNAGISGYSAFQGLRYLDKYGLRFHPSAVVACFGQNDFDTWNAKTDIEQAVEFAQIAEEEEQRSLSDFYVLAKRALRKASQSLTKTGGEMRPRLTPEEFKETLLEMKKLCDVHGIPLLFLRWPQEWQVLERKPERIHYDPIAAEVCAATGAPLVDLYAPFTEAGELLYADPVHGNAAGCRVAAEAIAPAIMRALGTVNGQSRS